MTTLEELAAEPWRFDFLDTLRHFERANADKPRIGDSAARDEEILLLGQDPYVEFPASNVARFDHDGQKRPRLFSRFLGLLGPQGALPLHLTIDAKIWSDARDDSFARFLDIFNHRFLQLFYRAWADARPAAQRDRPAGDRFFAYVGSAAGIGTQAFRGRDTVNDLAKLSLAGLLSPAVKSAARIEQALSHYFQVEVRVEQFVGLWLRLDPAERSALAGAHSRLGQDTMIGSSSFSVQDKIRIVMIARDLEQFESFLPNGAFCEQLADLMYFYLGGLIDYEVRLALPARATRPVRLGSYGRLGWTGWMVADEGQPREGLRMDCTFHPAERASRRART